MNKFLGTATLGAFEYDPKNLKIKAAGAAEAQGVGIMFGFEASVGSGGFKLDASVAMSKGCYGVGGESACTGILMEGYGGDKSARRRRRRRSSYSKQAAKDYDKIKGMVKSIGWPDEKKFDSYLPTALNHRNKISSYCIFKLSHKGIYFSLMVKARY